MCDWRPQLLYGQSEESGTGMNILMYGTQNMAATSNVVKLMYIEKTWTRYVYMWIVCCILKLTHISSGDVPLKYM